MLDYWREPVQERFQWDAQKRIVYLIESASDLSSWSPITGDILIDQGCRLEWTKPLTPTAPKMFYRLLAQPRQPVLPTGP